VFNDCFGNVLGAVYGGNVTWNSVRVSGYGPVLGYQASTLTPGTLLADTLVWRSRGIDPSGFYNLGARYYDPVAGHFLSPDPLGHEASMDLHSFCLGDPINRFDPTGRFGKEAFNGAQAGMADAGENGLSSFNGFGSSSNMKGIYAFEGDFEQGEKDVLFACLALVPGIGEAALASDGAVFAGEGVMLEGGLAEGADAEVAESLGGDAAVSETTLPAAETAAPKVEGEMAAETVDETPIAEIETETGAGAESTSAAVNEGQLTSGVVNESRAAADVGTTAASQGENASLQSGQVAQNAAGGGSGAGDAIPAGFAKELEGGGSWLMTEPQYLKFAKGQDFIGRADGQFMTSSRQLNQIIYDVGTDPVALGQKLNVEGWTANTRLIRMDVSDPLLFNARLPNASMSGANPMFISGGKTIGGVSEIVTDPLPASQVWATPLGR
jgi:RHS repeat-associated protein